jgi:hypothetical protein
VELSGFPALFFRPGQEEKKGPFLEELANLYVGA